MNDDLFTLDATAQAALVSAGQLSARELVDAAIARIEALEPAVHALAGSDFTSIHNFAGVPAMSVPLHTGGAGMPVGCHFAAARGQEARLMALAVARPLGPSRGAGQRYAGMTCSANSRSVLRDSA